MDRFKDLANRYYYSEKKYREKVDFIERYCTHTEGPQAGEPLILAPFQKEDILKPIFGLHLDESCRKRLINKVYIQMPRGNAKTTLLAAIELAVLFTDEEYNKHIYNCAGDDKQAGVLYETARAMVRQSPTLKELVKDKSFNNKLFYESPEVGLGFIEKITSKSETKHGLKALFWTMDEVHVLKKRDLYDTLSSGMGKRLNVMGVCISTPGWDKATICYYLYEYTRQLLSGSLQDDHFWGVIYGSEVNVFELEDEKKAQQIVREANPLYEYSEPLRDDLARELQKAKNDYHEENVFRRLRLGAWTESVTRPWTTQAWKSCEGKADIIDFEGQEAYMGISFTNRQDIVALALYFPEESAVFTKFWIPEDAATEYEAVYNIPFKRWHSLGLIEYIPGDLMEPQPIIDQILEWQDGFNVIALGYEKEFELSLGSIANIINFEYRKSSSKTYILSTAIKELKSLIDTSNFRHPGNEVLTWMQENVELKTNESDEVKFIKNDKKIGGLVAVALALREYQEDRSQGTQYNYIPTYDVKI